jgi:hypothetical protein
LEVSNFYCDEKVFISYLGPKDLCSNTPTAIAIKYDGIGTGCLKDVLFFLTSPLRALMRTVNSSGAVTSASYVNFTAGESWHGTIERAWIG